MKREELSELHYITAIKNVRSIMSHGILSHNRVRQLPHESVAMEEIQERRGTKRVPRGFALHDYVNLYIHARNPMLYKRLDRHRDLCVLRIGTDVLDIPGAVIADRNASSDYARFDPAGKGLENVDHERVFAEYWTHPDDPIDQLRHKSQMCAEVLVPHRVAPSLILGAYVSCDESARHLHRLDIGLPVDVYPYLFFQRG